MNNTNVRARVSEAGQVDPGESIQVSMEIAGGGTPFREFASNTLRSSSSGVARPLQTGVISFLDKERLFLCKEF